MLTMLKKYGGQIEQYTVVLSRKNHTHLGTLFAVEGLTVKQNFNAADEVSFKVHKYYDDNVEPLWDEITDLKYIFIPELNDGEGEYFEIAVQLDDEGDVTKSVTGSGAAETELGQVMLYNFEVNTDNDIDRDDYVVTKFYDKDNPKGSLLNRVLYKCPNYTIGHVDDSIAQIQRTFSEDGVAVYDFLTGDAATEFNCLFKFDSVKREISAYDMMTVCTHQIGIDDNGNPVYCNTRDEFYDVCPKCGTNDSLHYYGKDTTVYIDTDNLSSSITVEVDKDQIKNCFKLEAGDDDMTAAVRNTNPNGSDYIYYFSDEQKADMSPELAQKLDEYSKLIEDNQDEYIKIMTNLYDSIDKILYYETSMMPTISPGKDSTISEHAYAQQQADQLTEGHMSPIALDDSSFTSYTSQYVIESAIKDYAAVYVHTGYCKIDIASAQDLKDFPDYAPAGLTDAQYYYSPETKQGTWVGRIKVTSYNDTSAPAFSPELTITVSSDNVDAFLDQKIQKMLVRYDDLNNTPYTNNERYIFDVLSITDIDKFKEAIKLYSLHMLDSFKDAVEGCCDAMIEMGLTDEKLYSFYREMDNALNDEVSKRSKTVDEWKAKQEEYTKEKQEMNKKLDFEDFIGDELYTEFCAFRREDKYSNSNYISDNLETSAELFKRAKEFYDKAFKELKKASRYKYSISADVNDFLAIDEFKPLADGVSLGDWIRIGVNETVYRLRLSAYQIDFSDLTKIDLEFSDVSRSAEGYNDISQTLKDAKSMATSYSATTRQMENNSDKAVIVDDWVENGFDLTKNKVVNDDKLQGITINSHGILARRMNDITGEFLPEQLKIINNGMYITDDSWDTVNTAVGKFYYQDIKDDGSKEDTEAYGILADTIIGNLLAGSKLTINAVGKDSVTGEQNFVRFRVDGDGVTLNNAPMSLVGKDYKIMLDPKYGMLMGDDRVLNYDNGKVTVNPSSTYLNDDGTIKYNVETGELPVGAKMYIDINTGNVIFDGSLHAKNGYFSGEIVAESGQVGGFTIKDNVLDGGNTGTIKSGVIQSGTIDKLTKMQYTDKKDNEDKEKTVGEMFIDLSNAQDTADLANYNAGEAAKTATNYITVDRGGIRLFADGSNYNWMSSNGYQIVVNGRPVFDVTNATLTLGGYQTNSFLELTESGGLTFHSKYSHPNLGQIDLTEFGIRSEVTNLGSGTVRQMTHFYTGLSNFNSYQDSNGAFAIVNTGSATSSSSAPFSTIYSHGSFYLLAPFIFSNLIQDYVNGGKVIRGYDVNTSNASYRGNPIYLATTDYVDKVLAPVVAQNKTLQAKVTGALNALNTPPLTQETQAARITSARSILSS